MPCFFQENLSQQSFTLSPEESKHIIKSMRLKEGDLIWITDGKGGLAKAALTNVFKDACAVEIVESLFHDNTNRRKLHLAVAPTKNPNRIEWLVEKAVETGVSKISFLICDRSERKHVDLSRLHRIAVAALKQSQGIWLPEMEIIPFLKFIHVNEPIQADKMIAFCDDKSHAVSISNIKYQHKDAVFLIGPEGDFTPQEVLIAQEHGYQHISLGEKTLRTETAALMVACCFAAGMGK